MNEKDGTLNPCVALFTCDFKWWSRVYVSFTYFMNSIRLMGKSNGTFEQYSMKTKESIVPIPLEQRLSPQCQEKASVIIGEGSPCPHLYDICGWASRRLSNRVFAWCDKFVEELEAQSITPPVDPFAPPPGHSLCDVIEVDLNGCRIETEYPQNGRHEHSPLHPQVTRFSVTP